jgi:hypothetical protein
MMHPIQIRSEVGSDGILSLQVPMGEERARMPVIVTISEVDQRATCCRPVPVDDWHSFVAATYGSCAGLGLEEPDDLPLQDRSFDE